MWHNYENPIIVENGVIIPPLAMLVDPIYPTWIDPYQGEFAEDFFPTASNQVWPAFFAQRAEENMARETMKTPKEREAHLNHDRNPPTTSSHM